MSKFDFSGWATRNNLKCSDGRTILKDAFKHNDGQTVPLVWNHQHNDPLNVLGHALLENRDEGVYTYCKFNDTESGQNAKLLVQHGDVLALSIYANQLQQNGSNVVHGAIREVSLVLAGANPGAFIDSVMSHSDDSESDSEAIIYTGEEISLYHAEEESEPVKQEAADENTITHAENTSDESEDKTVGEIFDSLNKEQKDVVYAMISQVIGKSEDKDDEKENDDSEGGENTMKHNVFDQDDQQKANVISHSEMTAIIADGKRYGSLRESALAHGVEHIDYLFPDQEGGTNVTKTPIFIDRETGWVKKVMSAVHKTPFSRIKSLFADITADEARARGYMKGNLKKEEVFTLLKRTTSPTTVYKKQKLDRDDVIDVVDFDSVAWIKGEMRGKLDEELAGAFLVGDRRLPDSDDKIKEDCIRPIWTDDDKLFVINKVVEHDGTEEDRAKAFIKGAIKARKGYKGSGSPTLYTTEDVLTEMLLLTDATGRDLYEDEAKLAKKLRVKEIVTVPVMDNLTRLVGSDTRGLLGIIVNLNDYNVGADKGGAVSMFEDFDIDYNAQKYLIETRCSGALIMPFSAIVIEDVVTAG